MLPTHNFSCHIPNGHAHCTIVLDVYNPISYKGIQAELTARIQIIARMLLTNYHYEKIELGFLYKLICKPGYYSLRAIDPQLATAVVLRSGTFYQAWSGISQPEISYILMQIPESNQLNPEAPPFAPESASASPTCYREIWSSSPDIAEGWNWPREGR